MLAVKIVVIVFILFGQCYLVYKFFKHIVKRFDVAESFLMIIEDALLAMLWIPCFFDIEYAIMLAVSLLVLCFISFVLIEMAISITDIINKKK